LEKWGNQNLYESYNEWDDGFIAKGQIIGILGGAGKSTLLNCISGRLSGCLLRDPVQPRTDILELFDKIILLSCGRGVFFGTLDKAVLHFETLGYPLPPRVNPSNFFLDVLFILPLT
jgi:ABC-type multidrug transport system ATPase subunit